MGDSTVLPIKEEVKTKKVVNTSDSTALLSGWQYSAVGSAILLVSGW